MKKDKLHTKNDNRNIMKTLNHIPLLLAVLILLCLVPMPMFVYDIVRTLCLLLFIIQAIFYIKARNKMMGSIFLVLTLLFQPFFKIPLPGDLWNLIAIAVANMLLIMWMEHKSPLKQDK